jgi:methylenetetrahydrofolate dehydrogenase (NADP+)/methenyltetrahydrofolate cyclohydrolase
MSSKLLSGTDVSQAIKDRLQEEVKTIVANKQPRPKLVVLLVGHHPASVSYVTKKKQDAIEIGFLSEVRELSDNISQAELLQEIIRCNEDATIHGILVQLPLPNHIEKDAVINAIAPAKDVDGFHPINVGGFHTDQPAFVPCTPKGILTLLKSTGVALAGKQALVIGRSNIVGKPVALLLLAEDMTVTIAHSKTTHIKAMSLQADVIVAAVGKPAYVKADWIKPGAIVIDVGINRIPRPGGKTKLVGDVDFDAIKEVASWITPVPGGVGPMTIASLLENTMEAYKKAQR